MREFSQFAATPYSFKGLQGRVTSAGSASAGLLQRFGGSMQASLFISTVAVRQVPPLKKHQSNAGHVGSSELPDGSSDCKSGEQTSLWELVKSTEEWDGQSLPGYPAGQASIKVLRIRIPSGVTLPWHDHPVINAAVILKGFRVVCQGRIVKVVWTR